MSQSHAAICVDAAVVGAAMTDHLNHSAERMSFRRFTVEIPESCDSAHIYSFFTLDSRCGEITEPHPPFAFQSAEKRVALINSIQEPLVPGMYQYAAGPRKDAMVPRQMSDKGRLTLAGYGQSPLLMRAIKQVFNDAGPVSRLSGKLEHLRCPSGLDVVHIRTQVLAIAAAYDFDLHIAVRLLFVSVTDQPSKGRDVIFRPERSVRRELANTIEKDAGIGDLFHRSLIRCWKPIRSRTHAVDNAVYCTAKRAERPRKRMKEPPSMT
jgi:hypothetical protein